MVRLKRRSADRNFRHFLQTLDLRLRQSFGRHVTPALRELLFFYGGGTAERSGGACGGGENDEGVTGAQTGPGDGALCGTRHSVAACYRRDLPRKLRTPH